MSDCELIFEVSYDQERFNPIVTLRSLLSFTKLVGGINADIVDPAINYWTNHTDISEKGRDIIAKIQERLLQGELELRVLLQFPKNQELISALAQAYGKSENEASTYSRGDFVLLGYANVYMSLDQKTAVLRVYPDVAVLGKIIMTSSTIRSQLVNFCKDTGAIEAHWENFEDETLMTIWQTKAEAVRE